jgi:predicted lipoprotein with Yx(FWY)xxD motif
MSLTRLCVASSVGLAALCAAELAIAAPLTEAASPKPTKIELRKTSLGSVLATGSGFTVYMFTRDKNNADSCVKISQCTGTWPVLKTTGKPIAEKGARSSLLGTITLTRGVKQVTYAGHPLYRYVGDDAPGQTDYVGAPEFGGTWYAVNAAGKQVR